MNFSNLFAAPSIDQILLIVLLVAMVIIIIVLPMFTNKKRQKQINALQDSVKVGSTIKTVGGIIGKVVEIRQTSPVDKEMVIETGNEGSKTTMVFDIQAVYQVMSEAPGVFDAEKDNRSETVKEENAQEAETVKEPEQAEPVEEKAEQTAVTAEPSAESEQAATVVEDKAEEAPADAVKEKKSALTPSANSSKTRTRKSTSSKK